MNKRNAFCPNNTCVYMWQVYTDRQQTQNGCGLATQQQVSRVQSLPFKCGYGYTWEYLPDPHTIHQIPKQCVLLKHSSLPQGLAGLPSRTYWKSLPEKSKALGSRDLLNSRWVGLSQFTVHQRWPQSQQPWHIPLSSWEVETQGSWVWGQPRLYTTPLPIFFFKKIKGWSHDHT